MILTDLLVVISLFSLAAALPLPGDGRQDEGADVSVASKFKEQENQVQVKLKEVCYLELFADVEKHTIEFEKEVKIKDEYGKDVFVRDAFRKDEKNVEFFFREFCYKDFHFSEHNEDTTKVDAVQLDDDQLKKIISDQNVDLESINKKKDEDIDKKKEGEKEKKDYRLAKRDFDNFDKGHLKFGNFGKDDGAFDSVKDLAFDNEEDKRFGFDKKKDEKKNKDKKKQDKGRHAFKHMESSNSYSWDSRKDKDGDEKHRRA